MKIHLRNSAKNIQKNCLDFFIHFAYNPENKTFLSEIDNEGHIQSNKVHVIALSRLLYGFCTNSLDSAYSEYADQIYTFISSQMIGEDKKGLFFIPSVSAEGIPETFDTLNLWEQSYGFCGLVSYYEKTQKKDVIHLIRRLFKSYLVRFSDSDGTLCFNYSLKEGLDFESKQFQTIVYPITAFLGQLWLVDKSHRMDYEPLIVKNFAVAAESLWNRTSGCPRVHLNRHLEPLGDTEVLPGHFFQLGWFFRFASSFPFLLKKEKYAQLGDEIIETALKKPFMQKATEKGFPESINPLNGNSVSNKRIWWEHAEWINALCLYGKSHIEDCSEALIFFERYFVDYACGNEHFALSEDLLPIFGNKGEMGKSVYHTMEMTRFLLERIERE